MNKTKVLVLAATFAVLAMMAVAGTVYAQSVTSQPSAPTQNGGNQVCSTQSSLGVCGGYGTNGYACPGISGAGSNAYGVSQNGYGCGMGSRGGMMRGLYP